MKSRWQIYINGRHGLKEAFVGMLLAWRNVPELAQEVWEACWSVLMLVTALLIPFFCWLAPILAIFTAHHVPSDEEVCARLRANIHKNGNPP